MWIDLLALIGAIWLILRSLVLREDELRAVEQRLGQPLPADLRELLLRHNGYRSLSIDPASTFRVVSKTDLAEIEKRALLGDTDRDVLGATRLALPSAQALSGCWIVRASSEYAPPLLLCPPGHPRQGVIDLNRNVQFPSVIAMARSRAAQRL